MRSKRFSAVIAAVAVAGSLGLAGTVSAAGNSVGIGGGSDDGSAQLRCPGGMVRLSHVFDEDISVFPGDPSPDISIVANIPDDGFLVEEVLTGTHSGTHLSAPGHFIEGAATIDDLAGSDFVWPAYVIDVRSRVASPRPDDFQLSIQDIRNYERQAGKIPSGALVILYTGFDTAFGEDAYLGDTPGFAGDAVQWMFDNRQIKGLGSDTFGPDATSDADFSASYTAYLNDGITIENMAGLDQLSSTGDIVIASTVKLRDGSGYQTDPLGCLGSDD